MDWPHNLLFLLTISIFLGLGQPRNPKGKRKGPGRPGTLAPGPHQLPLDLVSRAKPYARMEEYERNLGEMVAQLRNSSEPARRKCEVDLQLWLSNKRSLSPWGYSINHDPGRIPADLPEAQCLCLGCVNPFTMQEDRSMFSRRKEDASVTTRETSTAALKPSPRLCPALPHELLHDLLH
uniref:Interleukin 17B n=1 Tax=Ovis aries TaxID=9940 RepID=A0AC11E3E0_SHEEP